MFIAISTENGWNLYRKNTGKLVSYFDKLTTIKRMVEGIGGDLTIIINGYVM